MAINIPPDIIGDGKRSYQMIGEMRTSDNTCKLIIENKNDYYTMQVILFFSDHPFARFNELAIIHALNQENSKRYIQEALKDLVEAEIIKSGMDGGIAVFSLVENMRGLVMELARLDVRQQQRLLQSALIKKQERAYQHLTAQMLNKLLDTAGAGGRQPAVRGAKRLPSTVQIL
jgi:hypothetical protein